jgi:predicted Zn-dependent protease
MSGKRASIMKKNFFLKSLFILCILFLLACQTVPVTERKQLNLIPSSQIQAMSLSAYKDFLSEHEVVTGTVEARMVKTVGQRISKAVETYMAEHGLSERIEGYQWEFNLIREDTINAWAMPGGKVVIYTGLLPIAQNDDGLAVVMGHEIAHAVAGHGNERMSQGLLTQLGGMALSVALAQEPQQTQQLFMTAYGVGAQVGFLLPYSRLHESEADHLGLIFMAMAGYDPHAAVAFWQRMMQAKQGQAPPEFLSTHPSDQKRIENIKSLIPQAMNYYRG